MRTAAILVASLLATIGTAAPMSESADNGLQLYKRQPLPPLTKDGEPSQSDDETRGVKSRVFGKLAKGVGLFKASRFGAVFQKMKLPGHRRRPKSANQEEQSADVEELMTGGSDSDSDNDTPGPFPKNVKPPQSDVEMEGEKSDSKSTTEDADVEDPSSSPDLSLPTHFPDPLPEYFSSLPPPSSDTLPPPPSPSSSGPAPPPVSPISDYLSSLPPPPPPASPISDYLSLLPFPPPPPPSPPSSPSSSGPAPPPAPPLPPSSGGSSPPSLRKVVNDDDSEKPSSASITPKSDSRPEVQRPIIDISEVNLKPVGQRPKPQHMPKSPSYQFQLRKMAHGGSKDQVSTDKNTDQETDAQKPSTSYQPKSPEVKIPPAVLSRPDMKLV
ncbi:hypothetical protein BASA83_002944 [Batrachochytrium salamandrivorans]|nr:hypothetical protein BASA83_002944 [Batrachochytrium salamandrivorans]